MAGQEGFLNPTMGISNPEDFNRFREYHSMTAYLQEHPQVSGTSVDSR